jgi:PilZ domain
MSDLSKSSKSNASNAGNDIADRRSSERFPFSAVTEIVDVATATRITARVSDISLTGCYLDVINVFAPGTKIQINIRHGNLHFEATGTVVYSLPGMGMGITFTPVPQEMASVLKRWIAQVKGDLSPLESAPEVNGMIQNYPKVERHILGRLIGLMMQKNMLTAYEGTELLKELLLNTKE